MQTMNLLGSFLVTLVCLAPATTEQDDDAERFNEAELKFLKNINDQLKDAIRRNDVVAVDQLTRTKEAVSTGLAEMKRELNRNKREENSKADKKKKADFSKLVDTISAVNDNMEGLTSSDINAKMKAICEVTASLAAVIPPPAGLVISGIAMVGSVIFGMQVQEAAKPPSTETVVSQLLDQQYQHELLDNLAGETAMIDFLTLSLDVAYRRELNTSLDCQKRGEESNTTCDSEAASKPNGESMREMMNQAAMTGIATSALTRSAIDRRLCELATIEEMDRMRHLFKMLARLRSLRFVMFTKMKLYSDAFLHGATHAYDVEREYREKDAKAFQQWIEDNLGNGTSCYKAAIFALYLLRNPVEGMEVMTDKIADAMKFVEPDEGQRIPMFILRVNDGGGDNFTDVGLKSRENRTQIGVCAEGGFTKVFSLHRFNPSDIKEGFVIRDSFQDKERKPSFSWGVGDWEISEWVSPRKYVIAETAPLAPLSLRESAFLFHPLKVGNATAYMFMLARKEGVRAKFFSFLFSSQGTLFVNNQDYPWMDRQEYKYGMSFKFIPYPK